MQKHLLLVPLAIVLVIFSSAILVTANTEVTKNDNIYTERAVETAKTFVSNYSYNFCTF